MKESPEGWLFCTEPWVKRRVVLGVPADAISLHYGFFLKGRGALWTADFRVEETTATSPLTATPVQQRSSAPAWIVPTNLTFSEVIDMPAVTS